MKSGAMRDSHEAWASAQGSVVGRSLRTRRSLSGEKSQLDPN